MDGEGRRGPIGDSCVLASRCVFSMDCDVVHAAGGIKEILSCIDDLVASSRRRYWEYEPQKHNGYFQNPWCVARIASLISGKGPWTAICFWPDSMTVLEGRSIVGFCGSSPVSALRSVSATP